MSAKTEKGKFGSLVLLIVMMLAAALYLTSCSEITSALGTQVAIQATIDAGGPTNSPNNEATAIPDEASEIPDAVATDSPKISSTKTASSSTANNWWKAYFVKPLRLNESEELAFRAQIPAKNYKGSIAEKLIQNIAKAKKTIHISSFEVDLTDISNALIEAKKRGVEVRWITDDESGIDADKKPGHGQFKAMKAAGIEIKDDARGALMHNKFWLFDGKITWTGSTNVTVSGMFEQNNNVVVISSAPLTAIYESQFADMWNGKFNSKSPSTLDKQSLAIKGTNIQVLFSPEDNAMSQIVPYVKNAKSSVYFMAFTFTHDDLGKAMIDRKKAGVDVQGVFEATGSDTEYSEMLPLYCAKAQVRQDGNPAFLHHKVIIIDKRIVITGSLNFTNNADESNNENVIIIDNAEMAKLFLQDYQKVWAAGRNPDPAKMKCK